MINSYVDILTHARIRDSDILATGTTQDGATHRRISDEEARELLEEQEDELGDLFGDEAPEAVSSPERMTDDEIFNEEDFEIIERTMDEDGNEKFWEVEECIDIEKEESPPRKALRDPGEPTHDEWEEHRIDHVPYRSWCPFCVKGRGTGIQHRKSNEESGVPVFGFDYFLGSEVSGDREDETVKILVAKCKMTKCIFAHGVPQKGIDPKLYAVERLKRDVLWLGHNKLILKSDNEAAILALFRNTFKALRIENVDNTQGGHSAAYDSSSNATTEAACRSVAGQIRTLRACIENRIKRKIPVTHCVFYSLIEHAAWLLTTRLCQSDGITAYKRLRGVNFNTRLLGFGELCLYKVPKKAPEFSLDGKLGSNWHDGIFLGYSRDSNEFVLWSTSAKKIVRARSVQRKSESARWNADALQEVNQRPQDFLCRAIAAPTGWREPNRGFVSRPAPEDEVPKTRQAYIPDLTITVKDVEEHGPTELGCPRCDYITEHGDARRYGYAHSKACRERSKTIFSQTAEGRERLRRVDERLGRQLSPEEKDKSVDVSKVRPHVGEDHGSQPFMDGQTVTGVRTPRRSDEEEDLPPLEHPDDDPDANCGVGFDRDEGKDEEMAPDSPAAMDAC